VIENRRDEGIRDNWGDEIKTTAGFRGPLIVLGPGSIKSKFLSLKKLETAIYQRIFILG
jgi:hypothetical protein